jgi:hypothetical protein
MELAQLPAGVRKLGRVKQSKQLQLDNLFALTVLQLAIQLQLNGGSRLATLKNSE